MSAAAGDSALVSDPTQSRQVNIIVCAVMTLLVAATAVGLRFYTRSRIIYVLGPEDWMILVALILSAANSTATIREAVYGMGKHLLDIPEANWPPMLNAAWFTIVWYSMAVTCTKISILLLYIRVLTYHYAKYAAYALLAIVSAIGLWYLITALTLCIPLNAFWNSEVQATFCWPMPLWWANLGLHIGTDILIFLLPLPVILRLRIRWRQKLLMYSMFAFGFFTCLSSMIRLGILFGDMKRKDTTYANVDISYWTCVEVNTAIVCACAMTLKPLILRLFPGVLPNSGPSASDEWGDNVAGRGGGGGMLSPNGIPLTIGSRPVRATNQAKHESWIMVPGRVDSDAPILQRDGDSMLMHDLEAGWRGTRFDGDSDGDKDKDNGHRDKDEGDKDRDKKEWDLPDPPPKARIRDSRDSHGEGEGRRDPSLTIERCPDGRENGHDRSWLIT